MPTLLISFTFSFLVVIVTMVLMFPTCPFLSIKQSNYSLSARLLLRKKMFNPGMAPFPFLFPNYILMGSSFRTMSFYAMIFFLLRLLQMFPGRQLVSTFVPRSIPLPISSASPVDFNHSTKIFLWQLSTVVSRSSLMVPMASKRLIGESGAATPSCIRGPNIT